MTASDAAIHIDSVTKHFGSTDVIAPLSTAIQPGQVVSLIGPSGCGKSTLLRIVAGLESATSGSVTLGGLPADTARRAKGIAIVPQQPGLLPWRTARRNAALLVELNPRGGDAHHDIDPLLAEVGLTEFADALPHQLSGGMQQRVALVRALALGSPVLLLDEPFAALDELTRTEMRGLLRRLIEPRGITAILVTHSINEAVAVSDRVIVLSPRPMRLLADISVPLPRPRRDDLDDDPVFITTCGDVRRALRTGAAVG